MRCIACNDALTDTESALKHKETGEYFDLCGTCLVLYRETLHELEDDSGIVYATKYGEIET